MPEPAEPTEGAEPAGGAVPGTAGEPGGGAEAVTEDVSAGERELLAAFDRLSPQGGLRWGFDDAMRRIEHPDADSGEGGSPWTGLPDDLWERGRSARIGQRFVGDVAGVMADILAADARSAAERAAGAVNLAVWDALRYLAARVEALEGRIDPLGLETAEWPGPSPDPGEWAEVVDTWLGPPDPDAPIVVGESGDGALLGALRGAGRKVVGVEPRGAAAWRSMMAAGGVGQAEDVVFSEVGPRLKSMPDASAAGVVLVGCVDRLDLGGQLGLLEQSVRVVVPGGTIVVLVADQSAWSGSLSPPARDLAPGRPLHPETWRFLLHRSGAAEVDWYRPTAGVVHAVVARWSP
ncbi:MAG: hypothetical protein ABSC41_02345 [Acidimicrobiales bacterium]|jgi:hypothetical protein